MAMKVSKLVRSGRLRTAFTTVATASALATSAVFMVSQASTPASAATVSAPSDPFTQTFTLSEQTGNGGSFVPYAGAYPPFGNVPPFHLIGVQFPLSGFADTELAFVKPGHSTEECGNPSAVTLLVEGQSLTAAQITAIYGSAQPHFNTLSPMTAVACWSGSGPFPGFINLNITIQND
jgi:hypothetical protein